MSSKIKKVVSLFSGCGGMDLGFEGGFEVFKDCVNDRMHPDWISRKHGPKVHLRKTGFETVFACDIREGAKSSWIPYFEKRGNQNASNAFHHESIIDLYNDKESELHRFRKDGVKIDVVTGGFPCQDFSVAGKRKGLESDKSHKGGKLSDHEDPTVENRGMLYVWMRKVVELIRPSVFVAENVKGLMSLSNVKEIIENDFRSVGESGYFVVPARVLRAPEYGIPQSRERVFFIGFDKSQLTADARRRLAHDVPPIDLDPYPPRTHYYNSDRAQSLLEVDLVPEVPVGAVLLDLLEPEDSSDLSQRTYSKAKFYGKHCQGQTEIDLHGLAPTIRAEHHGNIEFRRLRNNEIGVPGLQPRRLSVRECARIQTFPDEYDFVRRGNGQPTLSGSESYKLIGNAVPPLLAYHIAMRLKEIWPRLFG